MGLLNIQNIQCFHFETTQKFDEINSFLCIDPGTLMILIILSSIASCCTSVLKVQGLPHAQFARHGRKRQSFLFSDILQFPYSESLYLTWKTF
jgi:hypothetical protein